MNAKTGHAVATGTQVVHLPNSRPRNDGTPLRPEWFEAMDVNLSAAERRTPRP
jgi:deoxyribose-phosphate aldolase